MPWAGPLTSDRGERIAVDVGVVAEHAGAVDVSGVSSLVVYAVVDRDRRVVDRR